MAVISKSNGIIKGTGNPNSDVSIQDGDDITPIWYIDYNTTPPTIYKFDDNLTSGNKWVIDLTLSNADDLPVTPVGNLTSSDVQSALEEHQSDIDNILQDEILFKISVADLRASTDTHDFVYIIDNGKTGVFKYDSTDVASSDNTGTILVSNNGRRYKRQFDGAVNVKWFGAKGDGVTNDTAHIQSAINFVGQGGGGVVIIPTGTYKVYPNSVGEECLYIDYDNVTVTGNGIGVTNISCFTVNGDLPGVGGTFYRGSGIAITFPDPPNYRKNITISNLSIDGNANIDGNATVNTGGGYGWDITHKGIHIYPDFYGDNFIIEKCEIKNFLGELVYNGGAFMEKVIVRDCVIYNTNGSAVSVGAEIYITNNEIFDCAANCIECLTIGKIQVVENNYLCPVRFKPFTGSNNGAALGCRSSSKGRFENNIIENCNTNGFMGVDTLENYSISNNIFINCGKNSNLGRSIIIDTNSDYGGENRVRNLSIQNNKFFFSSHAPSSIFYLQSGSSDEISSLVISDNIITVDPSFEATFKTTTNFISLYNNVGTTLNSNIIKDNYVQNCKRIYEDTGGNFKPSPLWSGNIYNYTDQTSSTSVYLTGVNIPITPATDSFLIFSAAPGNSVDLSGYNNNVTQGQELTLLSFYSYVTIPAASWNNLKKDVHLKNLQSIKFYKKSTKLYVISDESIDSVSGSISTNSDTSGDVVVTFSEAFSAAPTTINITSRGTTPYVYNVTARTTTNFTVRVFDMTGAAVLSTAVDFDWQAIK